MGQFLKICLSAAALVYISTQAKAESSLSYVAPYAVDQLAVGTTVAPNSWQYKRYKCKPSDQYENSIYCRFTETVNGASKIVTILHLYNNIVTYINESVFPKAFTKAGVEREIGSLSRQFGSAPRIQTSSAGLIAIWGDIKLQPLTKSELTILTRLEQDESPNMGFLVDYLMDFRKSARANLPVYHLGGDRGFVWVARYGENGNDGVLRVLAADPSQMKLGALEASRLPTQPAERPTESRHGAPPSNPPDPNAGERVSAGTGFFVARDGSFVTNAHVIEDCTMVRVKTDDGAILDAQIVARDVANDLAILRLGQSPKKIAALREGIRLGEGVAAFGFPHADILSSSGNFTQGSITALSGMGDDSRYLQLSAPVQAGNSGGPLLDKFGNVVGVVSAKLNALKVAENGGDLPQNVNFALNSAVLATFLHANRVIYEVGASDGQKALDPPDVADLAKAISGFVICK
jgi:S1-C subfamily serine protease